MNSIEDVRSKSPEDRLNYFQEKLSELIKLTDISQIPTLGIGTGAIASQITLIDLQNEEMLKRYGLRRIDTPADEAPSNPLAN
jgi:hypothetical protein